MSDLREQKVIKKGPLGKGLNSLLGLDQDSVGSPAGAIPAVEISGATQAIDFAIIKVDPRNIEPNAHQPRKIFHEEELDSLAASIKIDGIIQPLIVARTHTPGRYMLIAGERRWKAAQRVGMNSVPVLVKDVTDADRLRLALIENIQRSDLTSIEEAHAYSALIDEFGLSQEQCALKVGKDRTTVTNALRLLTLPMEIQQDLLNQIITAGHAKALLSLDRNDLIRKAREIILKKKLNVRQTELLCRKIKKDGSGEQDDETDGPVDANLNYIAESIRGRYQTKIKLRGNGARGRIEISYFDTEDLERILKLMGIVAL